jgi:Zn finger protein HypA/HybF involved in hydrogenase expression
MAEEDDVAAKQFKCEDCGFEFEEVYLDIDDRPLACPNCDGLDIQLIGEDNDEVA